MKDTMKDTVKPTVSVVSVYKSLREELSIRTSCRLSNAGKALEKVPKLGTKATSSPSISNFRAWFLARVAQSCDPSVGALDSTVWVL